jgi:hypothetical protein
LNIDDGDTAFDKQIAAAKTMLSAVHPDLDAEGVQHELEDLYD